MKTGLLTYLFLLISVYLLSQDIERDSLVFLDGMVMLPNDSTGIPDVHVLNLSKGTGTVTSLDGTFSLTVRDHDTLKFSCIGYQDYSVSINRVMTRKNLMIFMQADTVLMDEVRILPLGPRRFFKLRFMETRVPGEKIEELELNIPGIKEDPGYTPQTGIHFTGPIQFLYDAFNRSARLQRKLRKNREKYSRYLVPEVGDSLIYPEK